MWKMDAFAVRTFRVGPQSVAFKEEVEQRVRLSIQK